MENRCPQAERPQPGKLHQAAEKYFVQEHCQRDEYQLIEYEPDKARLHQDRENILRTKFRKCEGETDHGRACDRYGNDARENACGNISFLPTDIFQGLLEYYFTIEYGNHQEENDADDEGLEYRRELVALGEEAQKAQRKEHQKPRHDKTLIFCEYFQHIF